MDNAVCFSLIIRLTLLYRSPLSSDAALNPPPITPNKRTRAAISDPSKDSTPETLSPSGKDVNDFSKAGHMTAHAGFNYKN
jgi:hypothetical protein